MTRLGNGVLAGITVLLSVCISSPAHAVTIDFDDVVTGPNGVAVIEQDRYADLGVILSVAPDRFGDRPSVVREPVFGHGSTSGPNSAAFGFQDLELIATFVDPLSGENGVTNFFSAFVGDLSGEPDPITVTAFGIDGSILGATSFTSQPTGVLGNNFGLVSLAISGIHQLIFSDLSPSGASLDDFTFNPVMAVHGGNNGGGGGEPVPEPATLGLLLCGLLGGARARKGSSKS